MMFIVIRPMRLKSIVCIFKKNTQYKKKQEYSQNRMRLSDELKLFDMTYMYITHSSYILYVALCI